MQSRSLFLAKRCTDATATAYRRNCLSPFKSPGVIVLVMLLEDLKMPPGLIDIVFGASQQGQRKSDIKWCMTGSCTYVHSADLETAFGYLRE